MSDIQKLIKKVIDFRNARNWKQFHNPKDSALSLALEAAEVMEHFQWKNEKEMRTYLKENKEAVAEELADVLYWVLLMSYDFGVDIVEVFEKKMKKNEKKYPLKKSKGKHNKYNQL